MTNRTLIRAQQIQTIATALYHINQNFSEILTVGDYATLTTREVDLLSLLADQCTVLAADAITERDADLELNYKPTDCCTQELYVKYGFVR